MNRENLECNALVVAQLTSIRTAKKEVNTHHICADCRRQFIDTYEPIKGYCNDIKQSCLKIYFNICLIPTPFSNTEYSMLVGNAYLL